MVTDTNILVRCSRGRAMRRVAELRRRGVDLVTTDRHADELLDVLGRVFGLAEREATAEVARVLRPFEVIDGERYDFLHPTADQRLRTGGKSDWPALAAALALDCAIWSEDIDFFGTGVAVWSSDNVLLCTTDIEG